MADAPRKPSWKDAAGTPRAKGGTQPAWKATSDQPTGPPWWRRRRPQFVLACSGLLTVATAAVVVFLLLRPAPPLRLVLLHAGYETNLALPHNVPGVRGVKALEEWAKERNGAVTDQRKQVEIRTAELGAEDEPLTQAITRTRWGKKRPETVVVMVSAHGIARTKGNQVVPCLVRHGADLRDERSFLELDTLLTALESLPKTNKLLILDVTSVSAHWPLGLLHNDFTRSLEALMKRRPIPNLLILCSSGEGERSWSDPVRGQTIFSHFVHEGLNGAGLQGKRLAPSTFDRLGVLDLCEYVTTRVEHWTLHNRGRQQRPVVLGDKSAARNMDMVSYRATQPPPPTPPEKRKDLHAEWEECGKLRKAWLRPEVYTPHLWRQYLDMLLRCEELGRSGEEQATAELFGKLKTVRDEITSARALSLPSMALSLPMAEALGHQPPEENAPLEALWKEKADPARYAEVLTPLKGRQLRQARLRLASVVVEGLSKSPEKLEYGRQVLATLGPAPNRPAEAHYPIMLHPTRADSPISPLLDAKGWSHLSRALATRLHAERAILSERVLPWVRTPIERGDEKRRLGQDLLCASDVERWKETEALLEAAGKHYATAQAVGQTVREALRERDRALAELPYYTRWVAAQPGEAEVKPLCDLWGKLHELRRLTQKPLAPDELETRMPKLRQRTVSVQVERLRIEKSFQDRAEAAPKNTQDHWHEIEAVLQVPFLDAAARHVLIAASWNIARELNAATESATKAPGSSSEQVALRQGRLALAYLGEDWPEYKSSQPELERAPGPGWEDTVVRVGERIGSALNKWPRDLDALVKSANPDLPPAQASEKWREAAQMARRLEGYAVESQKDDQDPLQRHRAWETHDLLCWMAHRTFLDFWASENPRDADPYFRTAGKIFLQDAESLLLTRGEKPGRNRTRFGRIDEEMARIEKPVTLKLPWSQNGQPFREGPNPLYQTDEKEPTRLEYKLLASDGTPPGRPVRWVRRDPAGTDTDGQRIIAFAEPFTVPIATREKQHRVVGYFRGHRAEAETSIRQTPIPDLVMTLPPPPNEGRLAVQTNRQLYDRFGGRNAAVALVLDCSGSMADPVAGGGPSRWKVATRAMREVLGSLPDDTIVSLRVFGALEFGDTDKTWAIRVVRPPSAWSRGQLADLMQRVERLTPEYATPLVRSIWQSANNDFPRDFTGARTIVALTDGADTGFYHKKANNADLHKYGKTIPTFLEKVFEDSNIQLHVIGFKVSKAEANKREFRELQTALDSLKGQYYDANDADALTDSLRRSLLQMYFLTSLGAGSQPRDLPGNRKDISRTTENARWVDLDNGHFAVKVPSVGLTRQNVRLKSGESLLLDLVEEGNKPALRRAMYGMSDFIPADTPKVWVPREGPGGWLLTAPQNRRKLGGKDVQVVVTLEKDMGTAEARDTIEVVRPRWTWFEVQPPEKGAMPRLKIRSSQAGDPVASDPRAAFPAHAWEVNLQSWPASNPPVQVSTWWTEKEHALGLWRRPFASVTELKNQTWPPERGADQVQLQSAGLEPCRLEVRAGREEYVAGCLVIRLRYPADQGPFFVQLPNWEGRGQEHRFFREAGKYTGIFWRLTPTELRTLDLQLWSVPDLKNGSLSGKDGKKLVLPTFTREPLDPNRRNP